MRLRSPTTVIAALAIIVLLAAVFLLTSPFLNAQSANKVPGFKSLAPVASAETPAPTGITVIGTGTAKGTPDIAFITVGVESNRATAQEAQKETADKINAALDKIRSLGVPNKDLQTTGINLSPVYAQSGTTITGYRATNQIRITVEDITRTGELLDAAVAAGANRGGQIQLGFKDDTKMRLDALDAAVKSAQDKAEAIAKAMGATLAGVDSVTEQSVSVPVAPVAMQAAPALGAPSPVLPGELSVTATVKVVYRFR
ncbi:MAG: SIMPL domain-containing protein [Bacteroidetes bacterium]|nr:SIMPL domain-containing protein [Bacteroidota bacterium]